MVFEKRNKETWSKVWVSANRPSNNWALNETRTTSGARLGMRVSIEFCFLNFRSVTFTFVIAKGPQSKSATKRNHFSIFWNVQRVITNNVEDKGLSSLADKTRIVPKKSKDKFCYNKFMFRLLHPHEQFQSLQIPSAPDLFITPASIVVKGFHLQFSGFIPSHFRILESPSFVVNDNYSLSRKLSLIQLHACLSSYDKWFTSLLRLCSFSQFAKFKLGQILSAVRLKIYPLRPKYVKSGQAICTSKMLAMTDNLFK